MLNKIRDGLTGTRATLAAGLLSAFCFAAEASNDGQCAALTKDAQGYEWDASYSAHNYSEDNIGNVGISIYPGEDLNSFSADELGSKLVNLFKSAGVQAECFINNSSFTESGTALSFKIDGLSIVIDGDDTFGMKQVREDKRILRSAAAEEAKTAKDVLASREHLISLSQ
ncbi:MAG: hypothetical protein AAF387_10000 [Pseudomonadota bacterium]